MNITPQLLGIFTDIYGSYDAMNIPRALLIALVGFITVIVVLACIALFIKLVAYIFAVAEKRNEKKVSTIITPIEHSPAPSQASGVTLPSTESQGELELIGVDEPTAAMLMALVSYKTNIPLNRLAFRSIKFVEEE